MYSKEEYARNFKIYPDDKIIELAKGASGSMHEVALEVLKDEILRRNLDIDLIAEIASTPKSTKYDVVAKKGLAPVRIRLLAKWTDQIIVGIVLVGLVILIEKSITEARNYQLGCLVLYLAVMAALDGLRNGQSIGKRITNLQVIDAITGAPCSLKQSFIRNSTTIIPIFCGVIFAFGEDMQSAKSMKTVISFVYLIEIISMSWTSKSQRIGERFANTITVYAGTTIEDLK